jgi:sugar/nucleoside kinase (ribokinase family)
MSGLYSRPVGTNGSPGRIVCLGEALVDLICPHPLDDPAAADGFEVHAGGALANVAVAAARGGADAALAGGIGADPFGRLLRERLEAEGVATDLLRPIEDLVTPFAFVTFDRGREPSYRIHGAGIEAGVGALAGEEASLLVGAAALVLGSNTLVDPAARAVSVRARELALGAGLPVLFDPNLRPGRWRRLEDAVELCRALVPGSFAVKANLDEARLLLDRPDADAAEAAAGVAALGARLGVVTAGAERVAVRGEAEAEAVPPQVPEPWPLGAGDSFLGTLAAGLDAAGWDPQGAAAAIEAAATAAALTCRQVGAFGPPGGS